MEAPARVATQTSPQPTNQPTNQPTSQPLTTSGMFKRPHFRHCRHSSACSSAARAGKRETVLILLSRKLPCSSRVCVVLWVWDLTQEDQRERGISGVSCRGQSWNFETDIARRELKGERGKGGGGPGNSTRCTMEWAFGRCAAAPPAGEIRATSGKRAWDGVPHSLSEAGMMSSLACAALFCRRARHAGHSLQTPPHTRRAGEDAPHPPLTQHHLWRACQATYVETVRCGQARTEEHVVHSQEVSAGLPEGHGEEHGKAFDCFAHAKRRDPRAPGKQNTHTPSLTHLLSLPSSLPPSLSRWVAIHSLPPPAEP